jgi:hypothetical protein
MKQIRGNIDTSLFDKDLTVLLKEIAVELGVRTPQTVEEVKLFEKAFAIEIQTAKRSAPHLEDILKLARIIDESDSPIATPKEVKPTGYSYLMAARNGEGITPETEKILNAAIQMQKKKHTNEL